MSKSTIPLKRTFLSSLLVIGCILVIISSTIQVQAYYDPQAEFATEVLLNKSGITYDLTQFEDYIENETVNVLPIEEEEYSDDTFGTEKEKEEESYSQDDMNEINNYSWAPGTYYIYRSNYNSDLGVVIYELNYSFPLHPQEPMTDDITIESEVFRSISDLRLTLILSL